MYIRIYINSIIIIACLVFNGNNIYSQDNTNMMLVDSKLWRSERDTIIGMIDYINQYNLQFGLTLTDSGGTTIKYYSTRDLEGFSIVLENDTIIFHSVENPFDIGRVFLRLLYSSEYSVYLYLELDQRTSILSFIPYYFIWKDDWLQPPITIPHEKEALLMHFSDCPEVEYKIKTGEYSLKTLTTIIEDYQKCKLTDEYEFFYE